MGFHADGLITATTEAVFLVAFACVRVLLSVNTITENVLNEATEH